MMSAGNVPEYQFLVGGEWRTNPEPLEVRFPYTGGTIARVHQAAEADLDDAAGTAADAFEITRHLTSAEKSRILLEIARQVEARGDELAGILVLEGGKTRSFAVREVQRAVATLRTSAEEAKRIGGEVIPLDWTDDAEGRIGITRWFPAGPVLGITPFNFPLNLACHKLGPAIAAGNPLILKPASATPISSLLLADIALRAGLPGEALSVVPCPGAVAERLVSDPRIAVMTFTGSPEVGWRLKALAGRKKVTLELGGNAAAIVHHDAPLTYAASRIVTGGFTNAGQVCISVQRVFLQDDIYDAALSRICRGVAALRTGDPRDDQTDVGPMIGDAYRAKIEAHVEDARTRGAQILTGGQRPKEFAKGWFYEPTVLSGVDHSMLIMREETFGPAVPLMEYTSFEQAVDLVNDCQYGLGAVLLSEDPKKIKTFFEDVKAGTIWINDPLTDNYAGPFGGMKYSGGARELGIEGLDEFRETKHIHWDFNFEDKEYWYPYGR